MDGDIVGEFDGGKDGMIDGFVLINTLGLTVEGEKVGMNVDDMVGIVEGSNEGLFDGNNDGMLDGEKEGFLDGDTDGLKLGSTEGADSTKVGCNKNINGKIDIIS